jgi:pilus assembly protein CpaB
MIVIGAVLVAAVAAFANYAYLSSVQDRAYEDAERLRVFVVAKNIAKGLPGEQAFQEEFIKADEIPREFRPATAITAVASIRAKVAVTNLSAGQVVVDGMFVNPIDAQITFSQRIPAGHVAVTVQVDQVRGVAGLLVPGDEVNILAKDPTQGNIERVLFQNVLIIAIGANAAPQPGDATAAVNPGSGLITFAVIPEAASKIVLATANDVYLTLVPKDNQDREIAPATPENLFDGPRVPTLPS